MTAAALPGLHRAVFPSWAGPVLRPKRYKSLRGGRGSGKSHLLAQLAVLRMANLLPQFYPPGPVRIASARQYQSSIKESVKQVVEHYIRVYGLWNDFDVKNYEIEHKRTGSHMWFPGFTSNPDSLMSVEALDALWIEQAETIGEEMEKIIPSVRKPGSEIWFSWNPRSRTQWCWKRFVDRKRRDDVSLWVNFNHNPWFTPELEEERRACESDEPDRYKHVWLGYPDDGDASTHILTYEMVLACIRAYRRGLAPPDSNPDYMDAGLDIGEGGKDQCSLCIRRGPTIEFIDVWPGVSGDLSVAARTAHGLLSDRGVEDRLYFDNSAPMKREFNEFEDRDYLVKGVWFGGKPGGPDMLYERGRKNSDMFERRNIQMADALRLRASRTLRLLKGQDIEPHECLFIKPDLKDMDEFKADLAQPVRSLNATTKKWQMDKLGLDGNGKSPDRFDAACLAFARDSEHGLRVL